MNVIRIAELANDDPAYTNGARWAVIAPRWIGEHVEVRAMKVPTLEHAIEQAERSELEMMLVCKMDAVSLKNQPQTISAQKQTIEGARGMRERGKDRDWSVIFNDANQMMQK